MKKPSRILSFILILAAVFSIMAVPAYADKTVYHYIPITEGRAFTTKNNNDYYFDESLGTWIDEYNTYKYKLTAESMVKIDCSWSGENHCIIQFYRSKAAASSVKDVRFTRSGTKYLALEKGTYYIQFSQYHGENDPKIKVRFVSTPQADINRQNFSRANAITLKPKAWATIAQTPNNNYNRWYKINLTQKQVIHITTNARSAEYVTLYNARFKHISGNRTSNQILTKAKMPKGTYYIKVSSVKDHMPGGPSAYIRLKWY